MGVSLKSRIFESGELLQALELDLETGQMVYPDGRLESVSLDEWPILSFLKGMGFGQVQFNSNDAGLVERWAERIYGYEQLFLEDPDNLKVMEFNWDEVDPQSGRCLIRCIRQSGPTNPARQQTSYWVPPMLAPLGITEDQRARFVSEIESQSAAETISRFTTILNEFKRASSQIDDQVWGALLLDFITITLKEKHLDRAIQIAEEHREALIPTWSRFDKVQEALSAYDPKPTELALWAKIFEGISTQALVGFLQHFLGSTAGPQLLKLMNFRAQRDPELLVDFAFDSPASVQKLLLQWLAPHWKPFHYSRLLNAFEESVRRNADEDLMKLWMGALLQASKAHVFGDLFKIFKPKLFGLFGNPAPLTARRAIIRVLAEHPSADCREFLKNIRKYVQGELADQVEKLLQTHREVRS